MKTLIFIFALLCVGFIGCASPTPRKVRQIAVPLPGGGKQMLTSAALPDEPVFKPAAIVGTRTFTWRYHLPQGTTVSNFWWDLQRSTNLVAWTTIQTNIVAPVDVLITNEIEYFRLKGRL